MSNGEWESGKAVEAELLVGGEDGKET